MSSLGEPQTEVSNSWPSANYWLSERLSAVPGFGDRSRRDLVPDLALIRVVVDQLLLAGWTRRPILGR